MELYRIVTAADEVFAEGLCMLVKSINKLWVSEDPLELYVLNNGLSEDSLAKAELIFKEGKEHFSLKSIDVAEMIPEDLPGFRGENVSSYYARLWIVELFDYDDVLYCDSDFMFGLNPKGLIDECRLIEKPVCAVEDMGVVLKDDCPWIDEICEGDRSHPYFNSGLMHWKLNHPVFESFINRAVTLIKRANIRPRYADQTVLNFLFLNHVYLLDSKYNQIKLRNSNVVTWRGGANLHFIGWDKPFFRTNHNYSRLVRNLIFRYLYDEKMDFDSFYRSHKSRLYSVLERLKFLVYPVFKPKRYEGLKKNYVTRSELEKLHQFLVDYCASDWGSRNL